MPLSLRQVVCNNVVAKFSQTQRHKSIEDLFKDEKKDESSVVEFSLLGDVDPASLQVRATIRRERQR